MESMLRKAALGKSRGWSERQLEILDVLQALFLAEGFRHFTIADLVDRLHCSRRTLYGTPPRKEELVLVVIGRLLNEMGVEARAQAARHDDPGDAIAAYLQTAITTFRDARPAFNEDLESYLPTKHLYDRHLLVAQQVVCELIEKGIAAGVFRPFHAALIAEILESAIDRIRQPDVLARAQISSAQAITELSAFIRAGLAATPIAAAARDGRAKVVTRT